MNVQNIPREDSVVKSAFCPKLDAFLYFDFPNIEAKLLAYYLNALNHCEMAAAFRGEGVARLGFEAGVELDLHILTAAGVYDIPYGELLARYKAGDKEADLMRQVGKRLNFSIIFGGGVPTLLKQGVAKTGAEAMKLLRGYHATWPGIGWASKAKPANPGTFGWHLKQTMVKRALLAGDPDRGYVKTLWGRHLHPPSDHVLINHLVQGCAADLMKWSLINVRRYLKTEGFESHLVNTVHDELQIDCRSIEIPEIVRHVPTLMTYDLIEAVVPITPEPDISTTTWAEKKPHATDIPY